MNSFLKTFLVAFIFFGSFSAMAQQHKKSEKLEKTVENFRKALVHPTQENLQKFTSKDLDYWHSSGKHQDQAAFMKTLLDGDSDFVTLEFNNQVIKIHGKTAIVHHILEGKTNDFGKPGYVKIGNMLVFQW